MKKKTGNEATPLSHQAHLTIRHHAPDFQVCVIYRGESFAGVRGPGYFWINPLSERVGEMVSTKPRGREFVIKNLLTRDPVSIGLAGKVSFTFDPREGDAVPISRLVKLPPDTLNEALGSAMEEFIFKAIRARVNDYFFETVQRGATLARLETDALAELAELKALKFLGIRDVGILFTHIVLSEDLQTRLTESAQRRYNAQVSSELPQADLLRSLIIELVEKVSRDGNLEQLFNFTEAVNTLRQVEGPVSPVRGLGAPSEPQTIDGQAQIKPIESTPSASSTKAPRDTDESSRQPLKPKSKSPKPKPKGGRGKKPTSPSYLDPDL